MTDEKASPHKPKIQDSFAGLDILAPEKAQDAQGNESSSEGNAPKK